MNVILKEDVEKLGRAGAVVKVRGGFARNFLIPRDLAIPATKNNLKTFEHERRASEARRTKLEKSAVALKDKLEKVSCSISKKVGDQDKLFGSVTAQDIEKALQSEGFEINRKDILLEEPIKALGVYTIPIRVYEGVIANAKVWVVRED